MYTLKILSPTEIEPEHLLPEHGARVRFPLEQKYLSIHFGSRLISTYIRMAHDYFDLMSLLYFK